MACARIMTSRCGELVQTTSCIIVVDIAAGTFYLAEEGVRLLGVCVETR